MRRRTWLLLAVMGVVMLGLISASVQLVRSGREPSATTSRASNTGVSAADRELAEELGSWAEDWLETLPPAPTAPLDCPGELVRRYAAPSTGDARGCVWQDFAFDVFIRIQNLSRVPMTVRHGVDFVTLLPGVTRDFKVTDQKTSQGLVYTLDLRPAAAAAIFDYAERGQSPALAWLNCSNALTAECLRASLLRVLPRELRIRGEKVPADRVAGLAEAVWAYPPLVEAHRELVRGGTAGTLTVLTR